MSEKYVVKTWDEIQDAFEKMNSMSCKPTFQKLKAGTVIDEDKSVRWNRDQVEANNAKYQETVAKLNTDKNKAYNEIYKDICRKIQSELPFVTNEGAGVIYNFAYKQGHSAGFYEVCSYLHDVIDLFQSVQGKSGGGV